jgi:hypothetical protein
MPRVRDDIYFNVIASRVTRDYRNVDCKIFFLTRLYFIVAFYLTNTHGVIGLSPMINR